MKAWFTEHRWAILGATVLAYLVRLVIAAWLAGELSTISFVILGAVAVFELGCAWYLIRGFSQYRNDPAVIDQEARRLENRKPRKRFGNAPTILP